MDTTSPEHPSNQIPDAAYPTSDYRPTNNLSSHSKGDQDLPIPLHPISTGQAGSSSSSSRPSEAPHNRWQSDALHLDPDYVPPPPYEESSRPNTSSQNPLSHSTTTGLPPSPSQSVSSTTLLRPPGNLPPTDVSRPPATHLPFNVPFAGRFSRLGAPDNSHQMGIHNGQYGGQAGWVNQGAQLNRAKRARRKRMMCCIGVLVAAFIIAFIIGLSLGLKKDDDDDDDPPPFGPIPTRSPKPLGPNGFDNGG